MTKASNTIPSGLLSTLEEITAVASKVRDAAKKLTDIVCLIGNRFGTDVCSLYVYFDGDDGELVLTATVGLFQDSVGHVRMRPREGLAGLVVEQNAPVMVPDEAATHPRFKYFPEAGEDPYQSFLGVPIKNGTEICGVLVVQSREPRAYSADEIRMLTVVGRHLGPVVAKSRLPAE